jgi:predicted transcriptional regulator of viral defense system
MQQNTNSYNYIVDYLNTVRAKGRYTVTHNELLDAFHISPKTLNQNLFRLKKKKLLAQIRKGFYAIIPPEYSKQGMLPVYLFIDDLMKNLNRNYYLGLYSAAAIHGAGHQQPMESQIMIEQPAIRMIENNQLSLHFFTCRYRNFNGIVEKKTDAGFVKVSSPELTALDLVAYNSKIGGINRIFSVLGELTESIKPHKLYRAAKQYDRITVVQRLGFLLDTLNAPNELSEPLLKLMDASSSKPVLLSLAGKSKDGELDSKWNVIVNAIPEL